MKALVLVLELVSKWMRLVELTQGLETRHHLLLGHYTPAKRLELMLEPLLGMLAESLLGPWTPATRLELMLKPRFPVSPLQLRRSLARRLVQQCPELLSAEPLELPRRLLQTQRSRCRKPRQHSSLCCNLPFAEPGCLDW